MSMTQQEFMHIFNDECRRPFNDKLFNRKTEDIVDAIKLAILSCQRHQYFTLEVFKFEVVEEYSKIMEILREYENNLYKDKKKKKINTYEYVNLKDSDVVLLIVTYQARIGDQCLTFPSYVLIPRIVDKYYFRISGNMYNAMYQIVDGSTYNNANSNAKTKNITQKAAMAIRVYKSTTTLQTINGEEFEVVNFRAKIFSKTFSVFKYFMAKYGLIDSMVFLGLEGIYTSPEPVQKEDEYCFKAKEDIYINVSKLLFDNDNVTQSYVTNLFYSIHTDKESNYEYIYSREFWLKNLGSEFSASNVDKGLSVLSSLEGIYDISTMNSMELPWEYKYDIYCILRWMVREFPHLLAKDNLDVTLKRIKFEEVIASLYVMKIYQAIYRLSDQNKKITVDTIRRYVTTRPTYLLESIIKCKLISYNNLVNDLDALIALKYTYKGLSGIGDSNSQSVSTDQRSTHISQMGILDMDSSPKSDPGMSGVLCPHVKMVGKKFTDFHEPNYWEEGYKKLLDEYHSTQNLESIITSRQRELLGLKEANETVKKNKSILDGTNITYILRREDDESLEDINKVLAEDNPYFFDNN